MSVLQVLFCGVTMSHYTQHNLSPEARAATKHIFEAFAYATNIFLFAYIGFVSSSADVFTPAVIVLAVAAVRPLPPPQVHRHRPFILRPQLPLTLLTATAGRSQSSCPRRAHIFPQLHRESVPQHKDRI